MPETVIRLDIRFDRRWSRGMLAALMFFSAVSELGSESVVLSTYYPAPSGVYTNMITTTNTLLARDGGGVGIGTSAPASGLSVAGTARASVFRVTAAVTAGAACSQAGLISTNAAGSILSCVGGVWASPVAGAGMSSSYVVDWAPWMGGSYCSVANPYTLDCSCPPGKTTRHILTAWLNGFWQVQPEFMYGCF